MTLPASPDPRIRFDIIRDGRIRSVREDHYNRLGKQARFERFFTPVGTAGLARILATTDPAHLIAARLGDITVGLCEIHRISETRAEVAVSVIEAFQGQGLGKRLLEKGRDVARGAGLRVMVAHTATTGFAMTHLLEASGARISRHEDGYFATLDLRRSSMDAIPNTLPA